MHVNLSAIFPKLGAVMHSIASEIVRSLGGRNGVCRCPAHDDKNPSLSLIDSDDGDVIRIALKHLLDCLPAGGCGALK